LNRRGCCCMLQPMIIRSLQQRLAVFLIVPVALLLSLTGLFGLVYARKAMIDAWEEASTLKLERAAHQLDMRLGRVIEWVRMFHRTGESTAAYTVQQWMLHQLQQLEGVVDVRLRWEKPSVYGMGSMHPGGHMHEEHMMHFRRARISEVTLPRYDARSGVETVGLVSDLKDDSGNLVGTLTVSLRFRYLMQDMEDFGWWQSDAACLVDESGRVLAYTKAMGEGRTRLGEKMDPVEMKIVGELRKREFGTVLGPGYPPGKVGGFFKLKSAPWAIVLFAPGKEILAPIVEFRNSYALAGGICILVILGLIRWSGGRMAASVTDISRAAERVAAGDYSVSITPRTKDEVGVLIRSFNTMVLQLEERLRLKEALDVAMEVQQHLLPLSDPKVEGLDVAGKSVYCDQTGGDYYDYLDPKDSGRRGLAVIVGDVSGHGIPSALLMATARGFLRQRSHLPGSLDQIVSDVNRQLTMDVEASGRFMTLFYMVVDPLRGTVRWVRAGHEPAILYDPSTDRFQELRGPGIALGVDASWRYKENERTGLAKDQLLFLGTDGIWEAVDAQGRFFGKDAVKAVIRRSAGGSARDVVEAVVQSLDRFRGGRSPEDDVTLVVIKIKKDPEWDNRTSPGTVG